MEPIGASVLQGMYYHCNWDRLFTAALGMAGVSLGLVVIVLLPPPLFAMYSQPYHRPWLAQTVGTLLLLTLSSLLVVVIAGGMGSWSTPQAVVIRDVWAQAWQAAVGVALISLGLIGVAVGYGRWCGSTHTTLTRWVGRLVPVLVGISVLAVLVGLIAISKGTWQCPAYERHLTPWVAQPRPVHPGVTEGARV